MAKRCGLLNVGLFGTVPTNNVTLNTTQEFVDYAENACNSIGSTFQPNSLTLVGQAVCSLCVTDPPYVGAPPPPAIVNIDAYNELVGQPNALSFDGAPTPITFMSPHNLGDVKFCFECQTNIGPTFGDSVDGTTTTTQIDFGNLINDCPDASSLQITTDGTVLGINSEDCCVREVVGSDVVWDGRNCKLTDNPCDGLEITINLLGEVFGDGRPLSEQCCTRTVVGSDVTWDGRKCVASLATPCDINNIVIDPSGVIFGDGQPLPQQCCTRGIVGIDVTWDGQNCLFDQQTPTPETEAAIVVNETPITVEECDEVIVSAWVYFGEPGTTCTGGEVVSGPKPLFPEETEPDNKCCYNTETPIIGNLRVDDSTINVEDVAIFNSLTDGFGEWVGLTVNLSNVQNKTFNVVLNFTQGLNNCCDYDIYLDDMRVDCFAERSRNTVTFKKCPGFDLIRVPDNKKSWVYNPGKSTMGLSDFDNLIRNNGDDGLIQGHGTINRTFAPSDDADIPWRFTDYVEDGSVYEKHSNLVLNSKEMFLTFNMCPVSACPDGFTLLTGGTCQKIVTSCPDGYTNVNGVCTSGATTAATITEVFTQASNTRACGADKLSLLDLEKYKNVFQGFWVQFIEQYIPATTIFVSGEKWCNNDELICPELEECDYDYEFVEADVTFIEIETDGSDIGSPVDTETPVPEENGGGGTSTPDNNGPHDSSDSDPIKLPGIEVYPTPTDPGITSSRPVTVTQSSAEKTAFLSRFTEKTTETIVL